MTDKKQIPDLNLLATLEDDDLMLVREDSTNTDKRVELTSVLSYTRAGLSNGLYFLSEYSTVSDALTAIGANNATILIDSNYTVNETVSPPSNVSFKIINSGNFNLGGAYTFTFNNNFIDAPTNRHIFQGTGTYTGTLANNEVYPEWFGAVGDGVTDDYTSIQTTLNIAERILFTKNYALSNQVTKTSGSKLTVVFNQSAIFTLLNTYNLTLDLQTSSVLFVNNIPDVEVYGFNVDGNKSGLGVTVNQVMCGVYVLSASNNVIIRGGNLSDLPGTGVRVKTSSNVVIEELVIKDNIFHGISIDDCDRAFISKNYVYGIGNQGTDITKGGIGILGADSNFVWIEKNYIENMSDTGTKTQESSDVWYINNYVKNVGKDGIKVQSESAGGINAHLIGNTVDNIFYWRDDGSFLIGAIDFDNVVIKNNILTGGSKATGTEDAIRVTTGSLNNNNVTIEGNQGYGVVSAFMTINDVAGNLTVVDNQGDRPVNLDDIFGDVIFNDNAVIFDTYSTSEDNVQFISNARSINFSNNILEGGLRGLLLQPNSADGRTIKINCNQISSTAEDGIRLANFSGSASSIVSLSINDNEFYDVCRNTTASRACIRFSNDDVVLSHLKIKDNIGYSLQIPGDRLIALQGSGTKIGLASFSKNYFNGVEENVFDTSRIEQFASGGRSGSIPTVGSYQNGDLVMNSTPSGTSPIGWVCSTSGTFGTLAGVTGSITSGTVSLTVNDASNLNVYQYINIVGVTGTKKIIKISGTTVTIDSSADATVSGASVSYQTPVFTKFGQLY